MPSGLRTTSSIGERVASAQRASARSDSRAARTVAGRAVDAQDCRLLLEMLGLDAGVPAQRGPIDG
jgi:hypothetical protein